MRRAAALLLCLVALVATAPDEALAQFYWPWQQRPAPPPPPPAPVQQPRRPRPVAKPATPPTADAAKKDAAVEQPEAPPPPYEPQLLRLSEIMGALAFLRPLCGAQDENEWRQRMGQLMDAEAATARRKERLAGAYNKGYREYAQSYLRCTPAAETIIGRYVDEGSKLARELASRYGG
ncbi:TIGR02301 family protein [uncultured Alsobacter sp.]|uniref:TIGR02301 family protein n=1 Tax=uncultured Alsobacter sp. TaxID=1748258 RepID=UPI0025D34FAA|nr:TIGR02301 family protein [uncultured Alsobacter sp.]